MTAITTVTRKIWRSVNADAQTAMLKEMGAYFDITSLAVYLRKGHSAALYDLEYLPDSLTFGQIEAHTELGGLALALRENVVYAIFTEQDGPGFAELWPDVTYHMIVSIGEPEWVRKED